MSISTSISDLARILSAGYPQAAASLRRELDNLRWVREHQPNEARKHRELVSGVSAECDQYRLSLLELVQLVRVHLPDVYPRLLIIPNAGPWHNDPSFDWEAAVVELRIVEAAAAGRLAAVGGHDPPVEPERTKQADEDQPSVTIPADLQRLLDQLPPDDTPGLRPAYRREQLFLYWKDSGLGPAAIRDRWSSLAETVRKIVSPRLYADFGSNKNSGSNRVKQALIRAKQDKEKSEKKTRKTTPTTKKRKT